MKVSFQRRPATILPGLYLAAAVIGLLWATYLKATRPDTYAGIGRSVSAAGAAA